MTDEDRKTATVAIRNARLADDMLRHSHLLTPVPLEQTGALLTAAFVLIEREVGQAMAAPYLMGLIEPQLVDWQASAPAETIQ